MKHDHKHSCNCEHDRVKFCKHCNTAYCLDCNEEWPKYPTNTYWTYQKPYWNYGTVTQGNLGINSTTGKSLGAQDITLTNTCGHTHN